jgi:hypothetical protein
MLSDNPNAKNVAAEVTACLFQRILLILPAHAAAASKGDG